MVAGMREFVRRPPPKSARGRSARWLPPPWNCSRIPWGNRVSRCAGGGDAAAACSSTPTGASGAHQSLEERPGGHAPRRGDHHHQPGSGGQRRNQPRRYRRRSVPGGGRQFFSPTPPPRSWGPAWGWPSARPSSRTTAAPSWWIAPRARGPPLPSSSPSTEAARVAEV